MKGCLAQGQQGSFGRYTCKKCITPFRPEDGGSNTVCDDARVCCLPLVKKAPCKHDCVEALIAAGDFGCCFNIELAFTKDEIHVESCSC